MIRIKLCFVTVFFAVVTLFSAFVTVSVSAAETLDKDTINIAMTENDPRYIDRILYEAFSRLGYKINVICLDITSAINGSNTGQYDGLGMFVKGLENDYENLIRISESISHTEFRVFANNTSQLDIKNWEDFSGLRVAFEFQHSYINNKLQGNVSSIINSHQSSELFLKLASDECDVVVVQKTVNQEMVVPDGINHIASIDKQPVYPFVHKSYKHLVPELTNVLSDMNNKGIINSIQNQERSTLRKPDGRKNFLYISSNSEDATWDEELFAELKAVLGDNETNEIYTVSLNSNSYRGDYSNSKIIMNMIRSRYASTDPDVIIVSDNIALEFIKDNYFSVFKGIPVVFCGINSYSPELIKGYEKYFTGVAETLSVSESTEQLLKMFPNTKNIFVINDYSDDGRTWQHDISVQLEKFHDKVNITYSPNVKMPELLDIIHTLPPNSLILSGMFFLDSSDVYYSEKISEKYFCQNSNVPVYSLTRSRIGYGEVGGKLVSGARQGRTAGEMALKLALGANVSAVPVVSDTEKDNIWSFDYNVLKKHNLLQFDFPDNTVFLNRPISYRESNPSGFYLILAASVLILALLSVLLIYQRMLANKNKSLILSQADLHTAEELLDKEILLRESKELLEKVVQTAPLVYIFSVDGKVVNSNICAQEVLDVFPGDNIENIYDDLNKRKNMLRNLDTHNFLSGEVIKYKTKDFGVNRFHINISKSDYQGKPAYIIWGINIESSEHQKDSLKIAHKDMQKILQALPIPLIILNPSDLELKYANKSYLSLFQQDRVDDFGTIDILKFFPKTQPNGENSAQLIRNIIKEASESSVPLTIEAQHVRADGELIDIKNVCETLSYKGTNSVIVLMQDVSAEKNQAEMLKNTAEKEKEANQLKSRFIINMSHEIRTPMNAIIGLSEIEMAKRHTNETYDTFRKINSSAKNLLTIVNDILDFSKIEAEKIDIIEDIFNLEEVISNAMIVASQRLDDKFVEMLIDIDCNLPTSLIGDKTRLWQVLKNLLDNSAKYTTKGNITMTTRALNKNPIDNIFVKFQIKDTGLGIKPSNLEKIFTPFEQFHQNDVKVQGTGLGMVITKQLTELMGGKISIESEYRVGTTVTVIIPFKLAKPVHSIKSNCIREELNSKRVLIVDDNPLIIDMLTSFLTDLGIIPVSARTTYEAFEKAIIYEKNDTPFDIVLLDYLLENETCLDLAKKIKTRLSKKTKLILLSAYSKRLTPYEISEHGFVEVIEKPFVPTSFVQKICLALNIDINSTKIDTRVYFSNAKVLLCEDNKINQEVAMGMLNMCNITPIIAENGQEALDLLSRQKFHLVLMDILMPIMDGHQTTIQIRNSDAPYSNIPIVAMTANAMKDEVDRCKAEGMNGHIAKPIEFDKLYAQLLKWLPTECQTSSSDIQYQDVSQNNDLEITIENIDMAQGISRFGGNRERYVRALYKYAATFSGLEQPFDEIITDANIETIKKQIHTIKGVTGNLGITQIYKAAVAFEKTLISKEPDEQLYIELQNICTQVNKTIVETFSPGNPDETTVLINDSD